jgi:hypothetical protein
VVDRPGGTGGSASKKSPDFADFKRWWRREGKDDAGGEDIGSREEAEQTYVD